MQIIIIVVIIATPSVIGTKNGRRRSSEVNIKTPNRTTETPTDQMNRTANQNVKMCVNKRAIWFSNCDVGRNERKTEEKKRNFEDFVR